MPTRLSVRAALLVLVGLLPWLAAQEPAPPSVVTSLKGHTEPVYAIAFTPDGKQVVTGSFDKTLKTWDAATGKEIKTFGGPQGHQGLVLCLALNSDGSLLASGGTDNTARVWDYPTSNALRQFAGSDSFTTVAVTADGTRTAGGGKDGVIRLWNTADGKDLFKFEGHVGPVTGLGFSPNGQVLVSAGSDRTVRLWNPADGKAVAILGAHTRPVTGLLVSPAGNAIVSSSEDGTVKFWTLPAVPSRPLAAAHPDSVTALTLSGDQNTIATACADKQVRLWSFANGQLARALLGPKAAVKAVAYAPNNAFVVGGTADNMLFIWNAADGKVLAETLAHSEGVNAVAVGPNANQMLSGGGDGLLEVWALPAVPTRVLTHPEAVNALAVSADGKRLVSASADKGVQAWNVSAPQQPERKYAGLPAAADAVAISGDGKWLAAGAADNRIYFWNAADGTPAGILGAQSKPFTSLAFNTNGQQIVSASTDGTAKVWQLPLIPPKPFAHPDVVTSAVVSADGTTVVTGCADMQVRLWNLANGQPKAIAASGPVLAVARSGTGAQVAAACADKTVTVWTAADGKEVKKFTLPAVANALAFTPDDKIVAAALADNSIHLLDVPAGKDVKTISGHTGPVTAVLVTPAGLLVSGSADKSVQVWDQSGTSRLKMNHGGPVTALALSKDGTRLLSGGSDKVVKVWNVADGKAGESVTTPAEVKGLAWHPDGLRFAVAGADTQVRVHGVDGSLYEFFTHDGPTTAVAYVGDGKKLISTSADKSARLWTPALIWQFYTGGRTPVHQAILSPNGDRILFSDGKSVQVANVSDAKLIKVLTAGAAVVGISVSGDGAKIAAIGSDKTVKIWPMPADAKAEVKPLSFVLPGVPSAVAFSPNGLRVAVALPVGNVGQVRVLDAITGKEVQTFADHVGAIRGLVYFADNRTLASAGADKTIRLFDVSVQASWEAHPGGVTSVAYHNNGTQALTGGADKAVTLWDLTTGKSVRSFGPLADPVTAVVFSRDSTLAGATGGKVARVWNVADGKEMLSLTHSADVLSLSFSQDKTKLVTGCADNLARLWDLATGQELQFFTHAGPVAGVVFHTNNTNLVTGGGDKTVAVQTVGITRLVVVGSPVRALTMTPNGSHVVTGSDDKAVKLWNAGNGALERTIAGAEAPVRAVAVSKNNVLLAAGGADGLRLYQLADGKPLAKTPTPGPVQALSFSPNNLSVAAACADKTVQVFGTVFNPGQPPPPEFGRAGQSFTMSGPVADIVFGPDNATLYAAGADKAVLIFRVASEIPVKNFGHPAYVDAVAFNKEGTLLATGAHDGKVRIFDLAKGAVLKETAAHMAGMPPMPAPVYCIAWSPDGKNVVSGSNDHSARMWDATTGALVREFKGYKEKEFDKGHRDGIFCVAFSPDGTTLATGSSDRTIRLWNVADGTVLKELSNPNLKPGFGQTVVSHPGWVYGVRFTPDGKFLVSAGGAPRNHGYLAVWNVADGTLVAGEDLPLGTFFGLALSPDGKIAAVGTSNRAGAAGQETNTSYLLKVPGMK